MGNMVRDKIIIIILSLTMGNMVRDKIIIIIFSGSNIPINRFLYIFTCSLYFDSPCGLFKIQQNTAILHTKTSNKIYIYIYIYIPKKAQKWLGSLKGGLSH